jgi:predicted transposase YbfD/YdcC
MSQAVSSSQATKASIGQCFRTLPDPRRHQGKIIHPLLTIVVIALCATVAGADDYEAIVAFARQRRDWFAKFVDLSNGIPSHDTFERVLANLNPVAFQRCLLAWIAAFHEATAGKIIAIDGKAAREAMNRSKDKGPLCLVTAWASANHMLLGQVAGPAGSNELGALPQLLELLELKGAIVTLDALGCQKNIVEQIADRGGRYVISVKGNQERLEQVVHDTIESALNRDDLKPAQSHTTTEQKHGRIETRTTTAIPVPEHFEGKDDWKGLKSFVMVVRETTHPDGRTTTGIRYFISNLEPTAKRLSLIVRGHWRIENQLHWQLDVSFDEDGNRARRNHAQANLGVLRRTALSMIKNTPDLSGSVKSKRLQAGWSERTLEAIIFRTKS